MKSLGVILSGNKIVQMSGTRIEETEGAIDVEPLTYTRREALKLIGATLSLLSTRMVYSQNTITPWNTAELHDAVLDRFKQVGFHPEYWNDTTSAYISSDPFNIMSEGLSGILNGESQFVGSGFQHRLAAIGLNDDSFNIFRNGDESTSSGNGISSGEINIGPGLLSTQNKKEYINSQVELVKSVSNGAHVQAREILTARELFPSRKFLNSVEMYMYRSVVGEALQMPEATVVDHVENRLLNIQNFMQTLELPKDVFLSLTTTQYPLQSRLGTRQIFILEIATANLDNTVNSIVVANSNPGYEYGNLDIGINQNPSDTVAGFLWGTEG